MSLRRAALALAVVLGTATSALGAGAAQATSAKICVALVIDGTALDSGVTNQCATVDKGSTGVGVLEAAGHTVGFRSDGLLCTIDNLPSSGCAHVDDTHYWAYFHRAPGATTWTYSTEGASTYKPANTSTEGWIYRDGGALTPPPNLPYPKGCKVTAPPTPTPSKSHSARPKPTPTHHPKHQHPAASATPSPSVTASSSSPAGHQHHRRSHHHSRHGPKNVGGLPGGDVGGSGRGGPAVEPPYVRTTGSRGAVGSASPHLGLIIGGAVILVLGGLAAFRFRRSS